jgi:hypothetical protein
MPCTQITRLYIVLSFLLIISILSCKREEPNDRLVDTKYVLGKDDFFIKGLYYQADSITVLRILGTPDSIIAISPSVRFPKRYNFWYYPDFQLVLNPTNTLAGIWMNHSGFMTANGLSVGDSISHVRQLYGYSYNDVNFPHANLYYCYNQRDTTGIIIRIEDNKVKSIYTGHIN